ncbi:unnamed protein product [Chironomus riparius]|uniref:Aminotransferase class V domain-containing protein n=1 Tax=Chironomus riparius TaxID=315576 RepID=A0A9P0J4V4_9DIPT|nr:unnamed protein product [Chironomus riparius]
MMTSNSALKKASKTKSLSLSQDDFIFPRAPRIRKTQKLEDTQKIFKYIDDNIIGKGVLFLGPYGRRKVVYADYASSGRSLQFLEDYINKEVLPAFGDTSCSSAVTGLQTHLYETESRDIIKQAINASSEDEIIFCNNPSDRLAHLFASNLVRTRVAHKLNTNQTKDLTESDISSVSSVHLYQDENNERQVILFVSQLEPIDNIKSWIDAGAQIERIAKNRDGFLDLVDLEKKLSKYADTDYKLIGLFSGVSRLSGIQADDVATTILLHQYNAISIWDFTAAISSAQVNMNSAIQGSSKDALFFSCNKMIGGLQAPSVLVIKKSFIENFTSIQMEMVDTVSVVRCGLVMQLKEALGSHIMNRHEKICKQMLSHIRTIPEIILLSPASTTSRRIPTMSFLIRHQRGAFLHHRFVVAVLNDVFGIQSTANNLIHQALGINNLLQIEYEKLLDEECVENLRPGFVRITLPFFMNDNEIAYILEALKMVATEAWKLLPQYEVDFKTGEWRHLSNSLAKERKWLHSIRYNDGKMLFNDRRISAPGGFPQNFPDCLQTARNLFNRARKTAQRSNVDENLYMKLPNENAEKLRWYMLQREAHELLLGHSQNVKHTVPFDPDKLCDPPSFMNLLYHRTNSLSALDVKRYQKSRSLPDTPQLTKISISPPKCSSPIPLRASVEYSSPPSPIVRFTLGGEVKCAMTSFSPNSLGANDSIPSRNSSCSDTEQDIQAYVKEVTKEITAEIKSEIREVISQVEDVLENSEAVDLHSVMANINCAEDIKNDSVSAGDIVEFLKEFSKDLTSEVTTEIREAANAVDEFIATPENAGAMKECADKRNTKLNMRQRYSDTSYDAVKRTNSNDKQQQKQRSESLPDPEQIKYTGAISKIRTFDVLSSTDSGINLSFHEDERRRNRNSIEKNNKFTFDENDDNKSESSSSVSRQQSSDDMISSSPKMLRRQAHLIQAPSSEIDEQVTWQNLPKEIWKQAAETIDEFDLIRDGDKILVCISGSSSSVCLIHLIRQFSRARGLHVDLSVLTVSDENIAVDPRILMLYLRDLDIKFIYESDNNLDTEMRQKLSLIAKRKCFNVMAMGSTLDKIADEFLTSIFYKGKVNANLSFVKSSDGDLRIIRPFIFIRERVFEDFSIAKNFPTRPSKIFTSMPQGIHSLLKVQEVLNPFVYENIKKAIHSLIIQNLSNKYRL